MQFTCYSTVLECTWLCSAPLCQHCDHCYLKSTTWCVVCQHQLELNVQLSSTWMCSLPLCQLHWPSSPYKRDQGSAPAPQTKIRKRPGFGWEHFISRLVGYYMPASGYLFKSKTKPGTYGRPEISNQFHHDSKQLSYGSIKFISEEKSKQSFDCQISWLDPEVPHTRGVIPDLHI